MVAGLIAAAPVANAVTFTIIAATFSPANGYRTNNANDLDVAFGTAGYWNSAQTFSLTTVGQSSNLFNVGLVNLRETKISQSETGSLGVAATFSFTSPYSSSPSLSVQGNGVALTGAVNDCNWWEVRCTEQVDYTLS